MGYIFLPCILLMTMCLFLNYSYFRGQSLRVEQESLISNCSAIDEAFREAEGAFDLLQHHNNFLRYLNGYYRTDALQLEIWSMELNSLLNNASGYTQSIHRLRVYPFRGRQIMYINNFFYDLEDLPDYAMDRATIYGFWRYDSEAGSFIFRKAIRDIYGSTMLGVVEIECDTQSIIKPLDPLIGETRIDLYARINSAVYTLTEDGFLPSALPGEEDKLLNAAVNVPGMEIFMEYRGFSPFRFGDSGILTAMTFVTLCAILVLSLGFFRDVSKLVKRISGFSESIAGSSRLLPPETYRDEGEDEFSMLVNNYNRMLLENQQLATQVELDKLRQDEMAYRILMAQIDPHFIYNALENIRMMAERRNEEDISCMSFALGRLLRYTFSTDQNVSTLAAELDLVEQYLKIQKYRLGNRLSYEIIAPEGMEEMEAPRFILQPIVENALKHGLVNAEQVIRVSVRLEHSGGTILAEVFNDGPAPEEDVIRAINEALQMGERPPGSATGTGIGLNGVNARMRRHYARSFGMRLEPREKGLSVMLWWDPQETWEGGGDDAIADR